jgi:Zinc finger, ZZ type
MGSHGLLANLVALGVQDKYKVCELFDARTAYLQRCQEQNLQFDTLRRAKHSSMMTLFLLHNPEHSALMPTSCAACQRDVPPGTGWKCEQCPDFELCPGCYGEGQGNQHPHKLVVRCPGRWFHAGTCKASGLHAKCIMYVWSSSAVSPVR